MKPWTILLEHGYTHVADYTALVAHAAEKVVDHNVLLWRNMAHMMLAL